MVNGAMCIHIKKVRISFMSQSENIIFELETILNDLKYDDWRISNAEIKKTMKTNLIGNKVESIDYNIRISIIPQLKYKGDD